MLKFDFLGENQFSHFCLKSIIFENLNKVNKKIFLVIILIFEQNETLKYFLNIIFSKMTIAEHIRSARQKKKMSQTELAQVAGVNIKSLSRYELGTSVPPADVLAKIAGTLEVTVDSLVGGSSVEVRDKELFSKFREVQDMEDEEYKSMVIRFLDLVIRDAQARRAYA